LRRTTAILVVFLITAQVSAQIGDEALISLRAVGKVVHFDGKTWLGTAFVAGESHSIFMPVHVAKADSLYFQPYGSEQMYGIDLRLSLPNLDMAMYGRRTGGQTDSYPYGNFDRVQPGDEVVYLGMCAADTLCQYQGVITAKGIARSVNQNVDFIDIAGQAVPGNSGSPVFNSHGQVIGMIVQAWKPEPLKQAMEVSPTVRAYSIDILRIFEQEVKTTIEPDSAGSDNRRPLLDALQQR